MEIRNLPAKEYFIKHSFCFKKLMNSNKRKVNEHSDNFNKERKYKKRLNRNCN